MNKLKLAYFGTPYFSANFLEKLLTDLSMYQYIDIKFVVTQPDRKVGRKQIITQSPVKQTALKFGIPTYDNSEFRIQDSGFNSKLKGIDLVFLYAFGQRIPQEMLSLTKYGFWCLHPSLLPLYRGVAPIAYPLLLDDKKTGVTIYQMDEKFDHGPIIAQKEYQILEKDCRPDLENKLTDLGFRLFKKTIAQLTNSRINGLKKIEQNHEKATYTKLLTKQDGFVSLSILKKCLKDEPLIYEELPEMVKKIQNSGFRVQNLIHNSKFLILNLYRAFSPWPGLWTLLPNGKRLKLTEMKYDVTSYKLQVTRLQLEGKREVDFKTFNKAYKIF